MDRLSGVQLWWLALCALSVLNLALWSLSSAWLWLRAGEARAFPTRRAQILLSAGYVLGCAFRSVFPRADVQRIVILDSWLSSVALGRTVATVAELCFAAQWALLLRELCDGRQEKLGSVLARALVPAILVAEACSWYAVLTTSYIGNALEQAIWTTTALLVTRALYVRWQHSQGALRRFLAVGLAAGSAFVVFMIAVDVPMYVSRWWTDGLSGRVYLSVIDGWQDAWERWTVTHHWHDWSEEMPWMSAYFSLAVWLSIGLIHAPCPRESAAESLVQTEQPRHAAPKANASLERAA